MKHSGSVCDYHGERDAAIMKAFRDEAFRAEKICIDEIAHRIVKCEWPRFYVSEERAASVVSAIMRGIPATRGMLEGKRRMFREIARRVMLLKATRTKATLQQLVSEVIYQSAPELYLSPRYVRDRIIHIRKK